MPIQLYIGFTVEGTTDTQFLTQVIQNVFEDIAFECRTNVVIEDVRPVHVHKTEFTETMLNASRKAAECGITVLCIHADSDSRDIETVMEFKFTPFTAALIPLNDDEYCKTIVPVIPIRMTEAWMLADKELLKIKIDARDKRDIDLGLHRAPESYADPKQTIEDAIRIVQVGKTKRRRNDLSIGDLYAELGQSITMERLRTIPSFNVFESNVRSAFKNLGYIE